MMEATHNFRPPVGRFEVNAYDSPDDTRIVSLTVSDALNHPFSLHVQTQASYDEGVIQAGAEGGGIENPEPVFVVPTATLSERQVSEIVYGTDPAVLATYLVPQQVD